MTMAVRCGLCPVCSGLGVRDVANRLPKARGEITCDNCQGQLYVPQVTCRGCGRAAIEWDAEVPYCGRKACWEKLVETVKPDELRRVRTFPVSDYRRGIFRAFDGRVWNPRTKEFEDSRALTTRNNLTPAEQERMARAMWDASDYMC